MPPSSLPPRDDLNDPIGYDGVQAATSSRRDPAPSGARSWGKWVVVGLGVACASEVSYIVATDDGMGGEPQVVVALQHPTPPPAPTAGPVVASRARGYNPSDVTGTITGADVTGNEDEQQGDVRVLRPGSRATMGSTIVLPSGAVILKVPQQAASVADSGAPDPRLIEKSRFGLLPKIAPDGTRPADAYAARMPKAAQLARTAPRIAIVVGGMGISQLATEVALDKLPSEVTLGFAPVGSNLDAQVVRARALGHEIVLQTPMESYNAADGLGEEASRHMLIGAQPTATLDNLRWVMGRATGYAGMMNFLGAKFLANEQAVRLVLKELAARGLYWFEDGSAPQSLSLVAANTLALPARRADVILDANSKPDAIDAALKRLEALAKDQGTAIGFANGLPQVVDRIGPFAQALAEHGVVLVPLHALMAVPSLARATPEPDPQH